MHIPGKFNLLADVLSRFESDPRIFASMSTNLELVAHNSILPVISDSSAVQENLV